MSRVWIVQSVDMAISIGRMKMDANYFGVATQSGLEKLVSNHVFTPEVWSEGELTMKRLQRLYHNLRQWDVVICPSSLSVEELERINRYAKERKAVTVLGVVTHDIDAPVAGLYDLVVHSGQVDGAESKRELKLASREGVVNALGVIIMNLPQVLTNNLKDYNVDLISCAESMEAQPWYDEVIQMMI